MHISVDAVNVMAGYQPVVLTCVHCGGRIDSVGVCNVILIYFNVDIITRSASVGF